MRTIISSNHFDKKLKKFVILHPELKLVIFDIINTLSFDPISRKYKAHKLSGSLRGCFGVSINSSYRITYDFDAENIYLLNIGSHDEVY